MKRLLIALIKGYCFLVSPMIGPSCRFEPSCSCYAIHAIDKYGIVVGLYLTTKRIAKCHPWYKGRWFDPVPEEIAQMKLFRYKRPDKNI